jgi:hypothetical protein
MSKKNIPMYVLGAVVVIGIFALVYILAFYPVPEANEEALFIVIGALVGAFTSVVGYFFGSSKSSADKNELLHNKKPE